MVGSGVLGSDTLVALRPFALRLAPDGCVEQVVLCCLLRPGCVA